MTSSPDFKVVCFGEVLWDILPAGALPGGAPMNVAYHLEKLGANPTIISRTGRDDYGVKLKQILEESGVDITNIQLDQNHPTGLVHANMNNNQEVLYDIVYPSAWDFIEWNDQYTSLLQNANYFVFGSLACRNETSYRTLQKLIECATKKVLDINLRPPYFTPEIIEELLAKCDVLKMNESELELVTSWLGNHNSLRDRMNKLQEKYQIDTLIVTRGGDGASLLNNGEFISHPGYKVNVADTIGSGDSFLAGFLSQQIAGKSLKESLEFSTAIGALIATKQGGCPQYELSEIEALLIN